MKTTITLLIILVTYANVNGQFITEYKSASGEDVTFNAVKSYNQNCIVAGNEGNKLLFCEISMSGEVLDSKTVTLGDESTYPSILSMVVDSDDNIVVTGYRQNTPSTATGFVLKYDFNLDEVKWAKSFDNPGSYLHCIIEPIAGEDYVVSGQDFMAGNGQEAIVLNIDRTSGDITAMTNINNGSNSETFYSIDYYDDSYYVSSRLTINEGTSKMRACMLTLDNTGEITSNQTFLSDPSSETARLYAFNIKHINENIFMAIHGDATSTESNKELYMLNTELNGDVNWLINYDLLNYDFDGSWNAVVADGSNIFYSGNLKDASLDEKGNMFIVKVDENGSVIWANSYEVENNYAYNHPDALLAKSEKLFAVGAKYDATNDVYDGIILVASQEDGAINSGCFTNEPISFNNSDVTDYNVESFDVANSFSISNPSTTTTDAASLTETNTCTYVGISNHQFESNLSVYPNPASDYLKVQISENSLTVLKIEIYNSNGLSYYIENKSFNQEQNLIKLDLSEINLSTGFYLLKITTNDGVITKSFEYF